MGSFDRGMAAALPVGSVIQSPLNLEAMTNGQWIALDGRDCNRSDYPLIQSQFPAGVFTSTARTLGYAPVFAVIAADSTVFLAAGTDTTAQGVQASPDGVTWTTLSSGTKTNGPRSLIVAGSRFVLASAGGAPAVTATGQTAAQVTTDANWTATTGGTTTTLTQGLAYGSTANGGSGRTVLVKNGSLATASGIFYLNDGATAWSAASGGSTADRGGVCWTGQKFICTTGTANMLQTSSDGATWSDVYISVAGATSGMTFQATIASDGNGTVVAVAGLSVSDSSVGMRCFVVSKDHGATWRFVNRLAYNIYEGGGTESRLEYLNGKFIFQANVSATNPTAASFSKDGLTWVKQAFSHAGRAGSNLLPSAIAYKAGVYCTVQATVTGAATITEDMSKFVLPISGSLVLTSDSSAGMPSCAYIKVRN